jgi:hypothetical protein
MLYGGDASHGPWPCYCLLHPTSETTLTHPPAPLPPTHPPTLPAPPPDIVATSYTKSVIKSRSAMTYAEAQARIDDPRLEDELTWGLRQMNRIAKILRKRRADAGALQLASPEVKFEIDTETHDPLDVGMYQVGGRGGDCCCTCHACQARLPFVVDSAVPAACVWSLVSE